MNFFEQELRKILEKNQILQNQKYVGRACYGTIGNDIKAKIEFVTLGTSEQYEGIKATILNRTEGPVDNMTFRFKDVMGRQLVGSQNFREGIVPHIWTYKDKTEWYAFNPKQEHYQKLSKSLNDYMGVFQPEMGQTNDMEQKTSVDNQTKGMQMQ